MAGRLSNLWPWKWIKNDNNITGTMAASTSSQEERFNRAFGRYEAMFFKIQSLLVWENPVLSTIFVIGSNLLYWVVVTLQFRFYSMASLICLFVFVYNLWIEEIWPEIRVTPKDTPDSEDWTPVHPSVLSVPEISHYIHRFQDFVVSYFEKAKNLRQDKPGLFCCISSCILFVLWFVGRTVPGVWLLYFAMNAILLLPGLCIHIIPPETFNSLSVAGNNFKSYVLSEKIVEDSATSLEADLMPEETPETLALLNFSLGKSNGPVEDEEEEDKEISSLLPEPNLLPTIENRESMLNSLTPLIGTMPSHDDDTLDGIEAELALTQDDGIRFRNRHFNGNDDSSSEDDSIGQGLSFSDSHSEQAAEPSSGLLPNVVQFLNRAAIENVTSSVAQSLASAVNSLSSSSARPTTSQPQRLDSDVEDDFEIINQEDLPSIS